MREEKKMVYYYINIYARALNQCTHKIMFEENHICRSWDEMFYGAVKDAKYVFMEPDVPLPLAILLTQ